MRSRSGAAEGPAALGGNLSRWARQRRRSGLDPGGAGGGEMAAGRDKVYHQRQRSSRNGPTTLFHNTRGGRGITSPAVRGGGQAAPGGAAQPLTAGTHRWGQGEGPLRGYFLLSGPTETHTARDPCLSALGTRVDLPHE